MFDPNVVSWTSLIAGFVNSNEPKTALRLFETMVLEGNVPPNAFTFSTVINGCSYLVDLETGRKIHALVETNGFQSDVVVCTSLVDMYGKSNEPVGARLVFDSMGYRNVVSWSSMITSYAQNAQCDDALRVFGEFMRSMSGSPNQYMLASVINACASLGRLVSGKVTHGAVIIRGYDMNEVAASALVDMYAKCGCIDYSSQVFRHVREPCVILYSSMIVGAAKHGLGNLSLELFDEMLEKGIKPNEVTFVGMLNACSQCGLVDIGLEHLNTMYSKHGIVPSAKHYTCVVDMLGRVGRLDEAYELAKTITAKAEEGTMLWSSLLSASRIHSRLDLVVEAGQRLIESNKQALSVDSDQQLASAYVTMSNTYASMGNWESAHRVRYEMKRKGIHKEPGCSWVEIRDTCYVFFAGDIASCARGEEVVRLLRELEMKMKERGYVGSGNGLVFVDIEEEAKEIIVGLHSEKLALGFMLLSVPEEVTIRVMKNLRMCGDCHEAFKLISDIVKREIVVRDVNRFHHFRDGSCTCRDLW
ncbi:hypothetical protein GIB67_040202 [Kingdonia uniflora]|uniref:DYW domain-containing protein n=1 Tax=Kingdonia uniflora TaxID=39325 RepID=A0A7J7MVG9_9MAGN|nr:hypothetical protein GIB67_040202 [Kingdonia uniflora]